MIVKTFDITSEGVSGYFGAVLPAAMHMSDNTSYFCYVLLLGL